MERQLITSPTLDWAALVEHVHRDQVTVELERDQEVVAVLAPVIAAPRFSELDKILAKVPRLNDECESFALDLGEILRLDSTGERRVGLMIDTGVFVVWERKGRAVELARWSAYGEAANSVITASELLTAVWRADSEERRKKRSAFVEGVLESLPIKEITLPIARRHAEVFADLASRGIVIGAHDLLIAATALFHKFGVLTTNPREFLRVPGLQVVSFQ